MNPSAKEFSPSAKAFVPNFTSRTQPQAETCIQQHPSVQYNTCSNFTPQKPSAPYTPRPLHTFVTHNGEIACTYPVSNTPRNELNMYSMDVECVATGTGHAARYPCLVVVVNYALERVLTCYIKPDVPVFNYLTEITGVKEGDLDEGEPLENVVEKVKSILGPDAWLVGQSIASDIKWMKLEKGKDYQDVVELSQALSAFNPKFNNYSFFSLEHEALVLLGVDLSAKGYHDPAEDAQASMELFKRFVEYGDSATATLLEMAKENLIRVRTKPSMAKRNNYNMHGICMAAFYPPACVCGDATLVSDELKDKMIFQAKQKQAQQSAKQG